MRGPASAIDAPADTDRILTIPNAVSMLRLAGIPVFIYLLATERQVEAAIALAVIAGTDWIDGGLARRLHQVTTLGKILDPTIDRFLLLSAFIGALAVGAMPVWLGVVLLGREAVIGVGGLICGLLGVRRISVSWWGKVYAFGTMVSLPLFLISDTTVSWSGIAEVLAWVFVVPAGVLGWLTAVQYSRIAWQNARSPRGQTP